MLRRVCLYAAMAAMLAVAQVADTKTPAVKGERNSPPELVRIFEAVRSGTIEDVFHALDAAPEGSVNAVEVSPPPVRHGPTIQREPAHGRTPVMIAAIRGQVDILSFLVGRGGDIFAKDAAGRTALQLAADNFQKDAWKLLSQREYLLADVEAPTQNSGAPARQEVRSEL